MPILIEIPEPRQWTEADRKELPSLRRHEHSSPDQWDGWEFHPLLLRCEHGVYLTSDPDLFWMGAGGVDDDDILDIWSAPYCEVCCAMYAAEWREIWKRLPGRRGTHLFRRRTLEAGENAYRKDKLFDRLPVHPETFTQPILLRGRTLTDDLRLQEDYETGVPKLETMGGFVAASFGYSKAGKGHGPDMDADNIRLAWMATHEEGPVNYDREEETHTPWEATLPAVDGISHKRPQLLSAENWQPTPVPVGVPRREPTPMGFLSERDCFADERTGKRDLTRRVELITDPVSGRYYNYSTPETEKKRLENLQKRALEEEVKPFRHWPPIDNSVRKVKRGNFDMLDGAAWFTPLEWFMQRGAWNCRLSSTMATARHIAQWQIKDEYRRGGGENLVPRRRTKRWKDGWQSDRTMQDLEAGLDMYRYGCRSDGANEDWCGVDVKAMMEAANRRRWSTRLIASEFIPRWRRIIRARLGRDGCGMGRNHFWPLSLRDGYYTPVVRYSCHPTDKDCRKEPCR